MCRADFEEQPEASSNPLGRFASTKRESGVTMVKRRREREESSQQAVEKPFLLPSCSLFSRLYSWLPSHCREKLCPGEVTHPEC